jgi:hypothetical protein
MGLRYWRHGLRPRLSWWLAGGINPANCIAAYQPEGAVDYTASKVNLANPGTYNATEGTAPDWDAVNGWKFDGSANYLTTGLTPSSQSWSYIIKFSDCSETTHGLAYSRIFGAETGSNPRVFMIPYPEAVNDRYYCNGGARDTGDAVTEGVMAIAGTNGYYNGVSDSISLAAWSGALSQSIYIGCTNDDGSATRWAAVYIQAFSIYNTVITAGQVAAITNAMNAL